MAGFQKFPIPKHLTIDFWNYNKKWIGNTISVALGASLFWMSFVRYAGNRKVFIDLSLENQRWSRQLHRPLPLIGAKVC